MTLSLCERLDSRRTNQPARLAYIIDGVERDNKTSIDHVFRIANGLIAAGIGKGDRIAVLSRNSIECAEVMTGILCSGASMVPVPNTATPEAQRNMLLDSAVKGLFVSDQYRDAALEHFVDIPSIRADLRFALETACEQFHDHTTWANTFDISSPNVHMALDEEYDILYSSALGLGGCNPGNHAKVQRGARERVNSRLRDHARHVGACAVPTHVGFPQSLAR